MGKGGEGLQIAAHHHCGRCEVTCVSWALKGFRTALDHRSLSLSPGWASTRTFSRRAIICRLTGGAARRKRGLLVLDASARHSLSSSSSSDASFWSSPLFDVPNARPPRTERLALVAAKAPGLLVAAKSAERVALPGGWARRRAQREWHSWWRHLKSYW